jgi:Flp pilus assembly protein TadG
MIEFAMAATVLMVFLFGTIEFGRMIWERNIVANASKAGVRWAAVRGNSSGQTPATEDQVEDYVRSWMYGIPVTVTTTWCTTAFTNGVCQPPATSNNKPGSTVQVVVQGSFTPGVGLLPPSTVALRSAAQMIIAR